MTDRMEALSQLFSAFANAAYVWYPFSLIAGTPCSAAILYLLWLGIRNDRRSLNDAFRTGQKWVWLMAGLLFVVQSLGLYMYGASVDVSP